MLFIIKSLKKAVIMFFAITHSALSWIIFILYADKRRLFLFLPTCYLAMILGFLTDLLMEIYPLWEYPVSAKWQSFFVDFLDELGVYFVVTYLFLQTLPKQSTFPTISMHIFLWTIPAVTLELIALRIGAMKHHMWWNIYISYI
jgi:hypothetical protein